MSIYKEDRILSGIAHVVMTIISLLAIIPFWLLIAASFSDEITTVREGYKFFPSKLSLTAYEYIFNQYDQILHAYGITILVTVIGTALAILFVMMLAYGLTQKDVRGVKLVFILVFFTMLFNGGIVPTYYVYVNLLHVKNTIFGLLLPNLLLNGFTVILVKNYIYHSIPKEMQEAAEIDGYGVFGICFKIIFPLATPIIATIGLLTSIFYWNDWTNGLYYITNEKLFSIQQLLNEMNNNMLFLANHASHAISTAQLPNTTVRMAIAVVAILPILCAYPFFQKYFAKGIVMGAVKA